MRLIKSSLIAVALAVTAAAPALAEGVSVIVVDVDRVVSTSAAGRDMDQRLRAIQTQMQGELQTEQNAVQTEAQAIQNANRNRTAAQVQADAAMRTRVQAFERRANTLRQRQVTLARDLEYTRQMALQEFQRALEPALRQVMQQRRAGAVIDRVAVAIATDDADATNDVISRLNSSTQTINVTRRTAPAAGANGGASGN